MNKRGERRLARIVVFLVAVFGLLSLSSQVLQRAELISSNTSILLSFGSIIIACLVAWFGEEEFVQKILGRISFLRLNQRLECGRYQIRINFDDMDGKGKKERTGYIDVKPSLSGVRIEGGKLLDPGADGKKNKITMNEWFATEADLVSYDNHEIIFYLYKIPVDPAPAGEEDSYEKIGLVYAQREKNKLATNRVFEGAFHDIMVKSSFGTHRQGSIVIWK